VTSYSKEIRKSIPRGDQTPAFFINGKGYTGCWMKLPGKNSCIILIALHQFTLPTSKYLNIRVSEKHGDRMVNLKVRHARFYERG